MKMDRYFLSGMPYLPARVNHWNIEEEGKTESGKKMKQYNFRVEIN